MREKEITAKEMEARLLLERQLAEEKRKTLLLEYESKFCRHELAESRRLVSIPEQHHQSKGDPHILVYLNRIPTVYLRQVSHTLTGYLSHCQEYQKLPLSLHSQWRHLL